MSVDSVKHESIPFENCKRILVFLPDDGTDLELIKALRRDKGITRVDSTSARAVAAL